jgi:hypothetical protein
LNKSCPRQRPQEVIAGDVGDTGGAEYTPESKTTAMIAASKNNVAKVVLLERVS